MVPGTAIITIADLNAVQQDFFHHDGENECPRLLRTRSCAIFSPDPHQCSPELTLAKLHRAERHPTYTDQPPLGAYMCPARRPIFLVNIQRIELYG